MADIQTIGDFYPRLLPHYLSDYEYTIRAHQKGYRLLTTPQLAVVGDRTPAGSSAGKTKGLFDFIMTSFSIKTYNNPLTWSSFILIRSPKKYWYATF